MNPAEITKSPAYQATMDRLEKVKRTTKDGNDYWKAREINEILGYPAWRKFEAVIERAQSACVGAGLDPSHHFVLTGTLMGVGKGAQREGADYFLSRAACYLIAMNGEPNKPEIAAAQAYFTVQTRRMELADQSAKDARRLDLREKVTQSFKKISGIAQEAGVQKQGLFHDARYEGLYGMSMRSVKRKKGVSDKENLLDRAGALELSANDFQMNLAADVIINRGTRGERAAIAVNKEVAQEVRATMRAKGATMPEDLPVEPPISEIKKRLKQSEKAKAISSSETGQRS